MRELKFRAWNTNWKEYERNKMNMSKQELIAFITEYIPDHSIITLGCELETSKNNYLVSERTEVRPFLISTDNWGAIQLYAKYYYHNQVP